MAKYSFEFKMEVVQSVPFIIYSFTLVISYICMLY